jgi:urea transport system substrate-binding protein
MCCPARLLSRGENFGFFWQDRRPNSHCSSVPETINLSEFERARTMFPRTIQIEQQKPGSAMGVPMMACQRTERTGQSETASSEVAVAQDRPHFIPELIGRYRVDGMIGAGATGFVYRAFDPLFDRFVAIKMLEPSLLGDKSARELLCREAALLAQIDDPHVVRVFEYGQHYGLPYLVLEYVDGTSLDELLATGPIDPAAATRICIRICQAVSAVHRANIVHRDIKPANIILTASGEIKLVDFGLSSRLCDDDPEHPEETVAGTPSFMSPEQCWGVRVDKRSDIYAIGATYFALLTATQPYAEEGNAKQIMLAQCYGAALDPRQIAASIPDACAEIVRRAMDKSRDHRFQEVAELESELALTSDRSRAPVPISPSATTERRVVRNEPTIGGQIAFFGCVCVVLAAFAALTCLVR